ncbi:hypothetical protein HNP84_007046 [Thermocatellispora tengchongensis]|uniref:Uncharacterized protein n=1 Tax=Thermocatellispora tengchongensis TaxID=1073253 RepID=A0A840P7H3_9ACTN|nr:hypothetical protein [Thermocatellispora tengchongensis]
MHPDPAYLAGGPHHLHQRLGSGPTVPSVPMDPADRAVPKPARPRAYTSPGRPHSVKVTFSVEEFQGGSAGAAWWRGGRAPVVAPVRRGSPDVADGGEGGSGLIDCLIGSPASRANCRHPFPLCNDCPRAVCPVASPAGRFSVQAGFVAGSLVVIVATGRVRWPRKRPGPGLTRAK